MGPEGDAGSVAEGSGEGEPLRKAVSSLTLDALILKEAIEGKY
jgi:hypothetical protein